MTADIEKDLVEIRRSLRSLEEALARLVLFEERQATQKEALARAFGVLEKLESRVSELERRAPVQERTTDTLDRIIWLIVSGVAGATLSWVLATKPATPIKQPAVAKAKIEYRIN